MGTYADYFNQHYDGSRSSGPVRVTISRGERLAVDPRTGNTYRPDTWLDEELMEFEADADGPAAESTAPAAAETRAPFPSRGASTGLHADTHLGAALIQTLAGTPASVWVLDTNTLLSSLDLLSSMLRELLSLGARHPTAPPLLVFVVSHVVLEELDALKNAKSTMQYTTAAPHLVRRTVQVGTAARDASRWLLATVQDQKYTAGISKPQWPLQVQTTSDASADQTTHLTNDQTIVALCASLMQNAHARVVLVSDDTNARMHAEAEGLPTTSPEELYRVLPRDRAAAEQLLMLSCSPEHRDLICHPRALAALAPGVWEHLGHLWDGLAGATAPAGPEEAMIE